jgi:hypothetical protein
MNEELWLTGTDPLDLLNELYPVHTLGSERPQSRQSRMYLLACARREWVRLPGVCRTLVALAEVYADAPRANEALRADAEPVAETLMNPDGISDEEFREVETALALLSARAGVAPGAVLGPRAPNMSFDECQALTTLVYLPFVPSKPPYAWVPRHLHRLDLLRETHGNPCRHASFSPDWRTDTAVSLARTMYEARDFSAMPILADALQDAGCDCDDILDHCRDPKQVHVRGCWVLDLVLDYK